MAYHSGEKIAAALRQVEMLKVEVLNRLSALFSILLQGGGEKKHDALASLLLSVILLGRRLGINYRELKSATQRQLIRRLREEEQEELRRDLQDLKDILDTSWKGDDRF